MLFLFQQYFAFYVFEDAILKNLHNSFYFFSAPLAGSFYKTKTPQCLAGSLFERIRCVNLF